MFGRSFFTAAAMMSLIALPLIVGSTREGLQAAHRHVGAVSENALGHDCYTGSQLKMSAERSSLKKLPFIAGMA